MLDTADLEFFATQLRDLGGLASVDFDPAKVRPSGVWLRVDTLRPFGLAGGCEVQLTAFLVVAGNGYMRSLTKLTELLEVVEPTLLELAYEVGPAEVTGLVLPASSAPLPALSIALTLHTT